MAKTLIRLLAEAKKLNLKVDYILLDKGFCWKEIIKTLNNSDYTYLVALKKNAEVKEAIVEYFNDKAGPVKRLSLGSDLDRVYFNATIHRLKKRKLKRGRLCWIFMGRLLRIWLG
jgi:hypothetical protein